MANSWLAPALLRLCKLCELCCLYGVRRDPVSTSIGVSSDSLTDTRMFTPVRLSGRFLDAVWTGIVVHRSIPAASKACRRTYKDHFDRDRESIEYLMTLLPLPSAPQDCPCHPHRLPRLRSSSRPSSLESMPPFLRWPSPLLLPHHYSCHQTQTPSC